MTGNLGLKARSLGGLVEFEPTVIVDSREQSPLLFSRLRSVRGTLQTGDYSVAGLEGLFAVERKSPDDLAGCCGQDRERFERELHRLRGFRFKRLLIVGTEEEILAAKYRSAIKPQAVWASLGAWETRFDLPVVFSPTPGDAARQIEGWAYWFSRELIRAAAGLVSANGKGAPNH